MVISRSANADVFVLLYFCARAISKTKSPLTSTCPSSMQCVVVTQNETPLTSTCPSWCCDHSDGVPVDQHMSVLVLWSFRPSPR
ncbi:hypothetical protein ElyMa_001514000 [Elysia marginata]|uniref:Secreted protein n=1 Tax=Elysia marginata TaxID=1093978 RepID=A0AAV4J820_9GAST|nr:hypothetical protein ElyMa_001514000 [Elysia marginata]